MMQHLTKANPNFTIFGMSVKTFQPSKLLIAIAWVLLFSSQALLAQDVDFDWVYGIGGTAQAQDRAGAVYTDAAGNVYTTGTFLGPADLEPGSGVTSVTSSFFDAFITKVDAAGNLVWAKSMGGSNSEQPYAIFADNAGNVYVIGDFYGGGDFDPGAGVTTLNSNGFNDIFVAKFDANGDQLWASSFGGSQFDFGYDVVADDLGNVYFTGSFSGTVDFEPGSGTTNLTSIAQSDLFIVKLNTTGNLVWAKNIGSTSASEGRAITMDAGGDILLTGYFGGTTDFDPGAGTTNLTSAGGHDIFVSRFNANGDLVWAKSMGGNSMDQPRSISVDAAGNVYTAGQYEGSADFDPSAGTANLTSAGNQDAFICKLDGNGDFVWAKSLGGTDIDQATSISVDGYGFVHTTGYFSGTADFDPGAATANLTSNGFQDAFVSKLDANGDFVWVKQIGGASTDQGKGIATDNLGNVYVTGDFNDTVDFDPSASVNALLTNGSPDVFVLKLMCAPNNVTETVTACGSYIFDGVTYTSDNNTATNTLTNAYGCDSIITLDLTIVNVDVVTTVANDTITANAIGATYQWINCSDNSLITGETDASYVATQSGDYAVIVTEGSCTDTSACVNVTISSLSTINIDAIKHQIYPNPTNGIVTLAFDKNQSGNLLVTNIMGQLVKQIEFNQTVNVNLDLTVEAGLYFVWVQINEATVVSKLVVE